MFNLKDKVTILKKIDNRFQHIHQGVVVGRTNAFLKVYRPKKSENDITGDVSSETAEWFPIESDNIKIVAF